MMIAGSIRLLCFVLVLASVGGPIVVIVQIKNMKQISSLQVQHHSNLPHASCMHIIQYVDLRNEVLIYILHIARSLVTVLSGPW